MADNFVADDDIREIAEAYALDAVDDSRRKMGVTLDWSEASITVVEYILDYLHKDPRTEKFPQETIDAIAKAFGSYIGQVFIRHHGGTWGMVSFAGEALPGIKADGHMFWPWARALKRLRDGPEENVWHYYLHLTGRLQRAGQFEPETRR